MSAASDGLHVALRAFVRPTPHATATALWVSIGYLIQYWFARLVDRISALGDDAFEAERLHCLMDVGKLPW